MVTNDDYIYFDTFNHYNITNIRLMALTYTMGA